MLYNIKLRIMNKILTKQKVVKLCENCLFILGQALVLVLGTFVVGAHGFAIWQLIGQYFN